MTTYACPVCRSSAIAYDDRLELFIHLRDKHDAQELAQYIAKHAENMGIDSLDTLRGKS